MMTVGEVPETGLPERFQFSQGSLQDFEDCRRRFQLRYLWNLSWPAVESEPVSEGERFMRLGAGFHHLVHQHQLGVPAERLSALNQGDETLAGWWENYLAHAKFIWANDILGRFPEMMLSIPLGTNRLVAKYDLLLVHDDGRATIVDWKTSRRPPRRAWMAKRLQTRVYPYLLARAGVPLNDGQVIPHGQIEMLYWFTNYPTQPLRFEYSSAQYQADEAYLNDLVATIQRLDGDTFPLTSDERHCAYCVYRSLCDRGVRAGEIDAEQGDLEEAELAAIDLDFDQIAEIEF